MVAYQLKDPQQVAAAVKEQLGALAERIFVRNEKRIYVDVPPEKSIEANRIAFEQLGARLATASGMDTRDRIEVLYHYTFDTAGVVVTVRTWTGKGTCELDSVGSFLPGAIFIEREIFDLLGVRFRNHPDPRRLILSDDWPEGVYPLRRDFPSRRGERKAASFIQEMMEAERETVP